MMINGEMTVRNPSHFHLVPGASFSIDPKVLECVLRPIMDSERKIGSERRNEDSR